jgi:RecA/RadA recombinase
LDVVVVESVAALVHKAEIEGKVKGVLGVKAPVMVEGELADE